MPAYSSDSVFARLDAAVQEAYGMVVIFLRYPEKLRDVIPAAEAFGSGFLLRWKDDLILVTADHVVREVAAADTVLKTMHETVMLSGSGAAFACDPDADIAVARVTGLFSGDYNQSPSDLLDHGMEGAAVDTGLAFFMGSPNTMNRVNHKHGDFDFQVLSMTLERRGVPRVPSRIASPCYFSFTRRKMVPGLNRPEGGRFAPDPHGMSGGPVLSVWADPAGARFSTSLLGVACEYNAEEGVLVAAHHVDIWGLIESLYEASGPEGAAG